MCSLHFLRSKRLSELEAEAMLHLDEVFSAEIYARKAVVVGRRQRGKEVAKPWVSRGVSFGTFLLLLKEKCEHSRVNPSVFAFGESTSLYTREALVRRFTRSAAKCEYCCNNYFQMLKYGVN